MTTEPSVSGGMSLSAWRSQRISPNTGRSDHIGYVGVAYDEEHPQWNGPLGIFSPTPVVDLCGRSQRRSSVTHINHIDAPCRLLSWNRTGPAGDFCACNQRLCRDVQRELSVSPSLVRVVHYGQSHSNSVCVFALVKKYGRAETAPF